MTEDGKCLEFLDKLAKLLEEYKGEIQLDAYSRGYESIMISVAYSEKHVTLNDYVYYGNLKKEIAKLKESSK